MKKFTQSLTLTGEVTEINDTFFKIKCQSEDEVDVYVALDTSFQVVKNLGSLDPEAIGRAGRANNRVATTCASNSIDKITDVIKEKDILVVEGIEQSNDGKSRFDARTVHLLCVEGTYRFEDTHWWITQIARLADRWLDSLFGDKRTYGIDDWSKLYQTDMNIIGLPTGQNVQECAVLSRLIYGLSAAYLIVGDERYRKAAEAAVCFQRESFRSLSHDGKYCFWAYGRRKVKYGVELFRVELLIPSESEDDRGSIPLYEQIYALAGLANYYRISLDWEVLQDIRRTVRAFNDFFRDSKKENPAYTDNDGYFSHIDYLTMRPDRNSNKDNNLKKNWNSIGDHIPAYLVNVILALDPLPLGLSKVDTEELTTFLREAREILETVTTLIIEKFVDEDKKFVKERFYSNWDQDIEYSWQKNRAVVGHNFKIVWNLTRVANYFETLDQDPTHPQPSRTKSYKDLANSCIETAEKLCIWMTDVGIDLVRGGCFDLLEREPKNGMPFSFTIAGNTKAFWQQEQAILAYLILLGRHTTAGTLTRPDTTAAKLKLMARQMEAFWNIFFLDRENSGMYFQVTDNGVPLIKGRYGVRGGHSDASGYHCFELSYLAHIYNRAYVSPGNKSAASEPDFCLHFKPDSRSGMRSINVLPDFMPPGSVQIDQVIIDGRLREPEDPAEAVARACFQIKLNQDDLDKDIFVRFSAGKKALAKN